jgi:hypothetical protein
MNQHDINVPAFDLADQPLEGRTFEIAACKAAIVKLLLDGSPVLMALTLDLRKAGVSLGIKRIISKIQSLISRFARIDRATLHQRNPPAWSVKPKNRGPERLHPVIKLATALRLENFLPL